MYFHVAPQNLVGESVKCLECIYNNEIMTMSIPIANDESGYKVV